MIPSKIRVLLVAAAVALAACSDRTPKTAKLSQTLPKLLLPPQPSFVGRSGGPDALQVTVRSGASPDEVTEYYRKALQTGGWQLVNEAKDRDGATVLFARQKGPSLWVRIQEAKDGRGGTLVELAGAVMTRADSLRVKADSAKSTKTS